DGRILLAGDGQVLRLWETATGKELLTLPAHEEGVSTLALSPDGKLLAVSGSSKTVNVWDVAALTGAPPSREAAATPGAAARPAGRVPAEVGLPASQLEARWADLAGADAA